MSTKVLIGSPTMKRTKLEIDDLLACVHDLPHTMPEELTFDDSAVLTFDPKELHLDFSTAPPPAPAPAIKVPKPAPERLGMSVKISLRVPHPTITAIKARAKVLGIPYQRLLNQLLKSALAVS